MKLVEEFREYRPVEADLPRPPIEVDTEARLNKREHGGAGPSLRRARDGIKCRRIEPPPREPAKQLRQPPQIHMARGLEQPSEDLEDLSLQAIAGQPQRDQRVVVRPDRAVMVRHRVIAFGRNCSGPHPPSDKAAPAEGGRDDAAAPPITGS